MQADDDVPSFQQLVARAEALQHDVEQAEHHRQTVDDCRTPDDDRARFDAAEHDLVEYIRKHRGVLLDVRAWIRPDRRIEWTGSFIHVDDHRTCERRNFRPTGDWSS